MVRNESLDLAQRRGTDQHRNLKTLNYFKGSATQQKGAPLFRGVTKVSD